MPSAESFEPLRCSFCRKSRDVVAKLIPHSAIAQEFIFATNVSVYAVKYSTTMLKNAKQTSAPSPFAFKTALEEVTPLTEVVLERVQKLEAKARSKLQKRDLPFRCQRLVSPCQR